jgi:hypothetical protein
MAEKGQENNIMQYVDYRTDKNTFWTQAISIGVNQSVRKYGYMKTTQMWYIPHLHMFICVKTDKILSFLNN